MFWFFGGLIVGIVLTFVLFSYIYEFRISLLRCFHFLKIIQWQYFNKSPRFSSENIDSAFDYEPHIGKPYLRYYPKIRPSNEYLALEEILYDVKLKKEKNNSSLRDKINIMRNELESWAKNLIPPKGTKIVHQTIKNVSVYWVDWIDSSVNNGIILHLHGGTYVSGSPKQCFPFLSNLSRLTGCRTLSIDYRLAPEYPLPNAVDDVITIYKTLLNEHGINNNKIVFCGESCGGGLCLLALQRLLKENILLPSCSILISPWVNVSLDSPSIERNNVYDSLVSATFTKKIIPLIIGNIDTNNNKLNNNNPLNPIYSPLFGEFKNLCPLYFTVNSTEVLLDEVIACADSAFNNNVEVRLDIQPYLFHVYEMGINLYPEAREALTRIADFILDHIRETTICHKHIE